MYWVDHTSASIFWYLFLMPCCIAYFQEHLSHLLSSCFQSFSRSAISTRRFRGLHCFDSLLYLLYTGRWPNQSRNVTGMSSNASSDLGQFVLGCLSKYVSQHFNTSSGVAFRFIWLVTEAFYENIAHIWRYHRQ